MTTVKTENRFRVGDKVQCIDTTSLFKGDMLDKSKIYTIVEASTYDTYRIDIGSDYWYHGGRFIRKDECGECIYKCRRLEGKCDFYEEKTPPPPISI